MFRLARELQPPPATIRLGGIEIEDRIIEVVHDWTSQKRKQSLMDCRANDRCCPMNYYDIVFCGSEGVPHPLRKSGKQVSGLL